MPILSLLPDRLDLHAESGETILAASLRAGISFAHSCGGNGRCSTCRVRVMEGLDRCAPRVGAEQAIATRLGLDPAIRLACQLPVTDAISVHRLVLDSDDEDWALADFAAGRKASGPAGEEREVTILFADIRGFTAFSEALPAYDVIYVLNRFFYRMGRAVGAHGGRVDATMGDGLMALFEHQPEMHEDPSLRAVRAAFEMLAGVESLNTHLASLYCRTLRIGIGVHTGPVVVGMVGASGGRRLTAIGDAVNFASRIEAANKLADTSLLVSDSVHQRIRDRAQTGKKLDVDIPGKIGRHELFEITGIA